MHTFTRSAHSASIALAAGSALVPGAAQAQGSAPTQFAQATTPVAAPLTIRDIYDRIEAAGDRDVRGIERDGGRDEVKARNAQAERVKLHIKARSGVVERSAPARVIN